MTDARANIRAVVSHPSKQGNMYRVPMGAAACGIPTDFLTGFYYKPGHFPWGLLALLPTGRRRRIEEKLERRRLAEMDPAMVIQVSGPLPELCYGWFKDYRIGNAIHDRLVVRWLAAMWRRAAPASSTASRNPVRAASPSRAAAA